MKSVVVTGVSSGIGRGIAQDLVEHGFRVFGSVRKPADGEVLKSELGEGFTPLMFDVTGEPAVKAAAAQVEAALNGEPLFGLVNNAGIAVPGPLLHLPSAEFRKQLEINTVAPLIVTQAFAPLLGARMPLVERPGRIVNMSSLGGRLTTPFLGAYSASKHALEAMSDAWRREFLLYGVDVVVVRPGAVATSIWDKAEEMDWEPYLATDYGPIIRKFQALFLERGRKGLPPAKVARTVRKALTAARPRTRYVLAPQRLVNWSIPRMLSDRTLDMLMGRRLGLMRKG